jgi:hypothetical protein
MPTAIPFEPTREKLTRILLLRPEEEMYADVLDLLLGVFESEFGYFGYISNEGHLVCPSMTRHIFPSSGGRSGAGSGAGSCWKSVRW